MKRLISFLARLLLPDYSHLQEGSLWIAKRRIYASRWSTADCIVARGVMSSGYVIGRAVPHRSELGDRPVGLPDVPLSIFLHRRELLKRFQAISAPDAEALDFLIPSRPAHR